MKIPSILWCECLHCGHRWIRRTESRPKLCAGCKTPNWDMKPGTLPIGRPPKKAKGKK